MLRAYYTGAAGYLKPQPQSRISLGGLISSTPIPNKLLGNLFDDINETIILKGQEQIRCIALKNEASDVVDTITISIEVEENVTTKFKGFLIKPAIDPCGDQYFEVVTDPVAIPLVGSLLDINLVDLVQGTSVNLAEGEYLGLWLQRVIEPMEGVSSLDCPECDVLNTLYDNQTLISDMELYKINIDYTTL